MNSGSREPWASGQNQTPGTGPQNNDSGSGPSSRPFIGRYDGTSAPAQPPQSQNPTSGGGPVLPPPPGSYHPPGQPSQSLPSISGLAQPAQTSPHQASQRALPTGSDATPNMPGGPYPLPALNQSIHAQHHGPPPPNMERRIDGRDGRELDRHLEMAAAEQRDRENRERHHQEQAAHENHGGPIQIHQPVAVAPQTRGIHGPNGLLGNAAVMTGTSGLPGPISAPVNGLSANGSGQTAPSESNARNQHAVQPPPQTLLVPFSGGNAQPQQQQQQPQQQLVNVGQGQQPPVNVGQGQQPILNDALSYLDQVKIQFGEQPTVYNQFLDIMKDFKSGAIDTPGVIDRVSTLFSGNPALIQGFNTFLPPGYRIECGTGDDPNTIRVTTPMGTTVSALGVHPLSQSVTNGITSTPSDQQFYEQSNRDGGNNWQQSVPQGSDVFGPGRSGPYGPQPGQPASMSPEIQRAHPESAAQVEARQLEQRSPEGMQSPPGGAAAHLHGQSINGIASAAPSGAGSTAEKRGPVEFNHAISYVNKIKNRFATQPDIYKQFLEILQTYQRESKPIQDVYAQVTTLFGGAPDLLEDFKQFLPDSTTGAQQRAALAARQTAEDVAQTSNIRSDATYIAHTQQLQQTPRPEQGGRLPPIGNFAPTPAKDSNKRKRGDRQGPVAGQAAIPPPALEVAHSSRGGYPPGAKRTKQHHTMNKSTVPEGPPVSPTLTPALPEPIPPTSSTAATHDELAFFDRAKKFIGNKNNMNEFLKLCNLFSQDLISSELLIQRAHSFLGGNPELMTYFKHFMGYDPKPETLEARAIQSFSSKVSLSNCRGLGPSYRLLPKRDRMRVCSGRDDLCRSVLNDEWASHPTWASEDSGFIAHRKNQHEEGLHRIEEERHDYDFNIEACLRTVQQLEPIAQQLYQMLPEDRLNFVLPKGLGGQSEAIYKRVILKVYGREKGRLVLDSLFDSPYKVVPVVLGRLKSKLEEWKAAQREWEKVWREQTQRIFWKSLDHQSIGAKQADKRQFQTKTLQTEIQVKHEEQKRQREVQKLYVPQWQFEYAFDDIDVLYDAARLVLVQVENNQSSDHPRLLNFMKEFIPMFFGLDVATFDERIRISPNGSPGEEDLDDEMTSPDDVSSRSARGKGKNQNLLRGVLDKGRASTRHREDSNASGSRATTPDIGSNIDDEMTGVADSPSGEPAEERPLNKWLEHPTLGNENDIAPDEPFQRDTYNMYANLPIYCFFRMLVILYERLVNLKRVENEVHDQVVNAKSEKPATDFKLIDKLPSDFFGDTSFNANYYQQVLGMFEEVVKGDMDMIHVEETLRRFYLQNGWQLYSVDKLLSSLGRFAVAVLTSDTKDKSWDIYQLFKKDRQRRETTHKDEINYRRQVEKYAKDGDVYRICFVSIDLAISKSFSNACLQKQNEMKATVQIFKKDDLTFDQRNYTAEQRWRYYISTFTNVDPTEGMENTRLSKVFLAHGLDDNESDASNSSLKSSYITSNDVMTIRIAVHSYKMIFEPKTEEYLVKSNKDRTGGKEGLEAIKNESIRAGEKAREKLVLNNSWMKGMSKEEVDAINAEYARLKGEKIESTSANAGTDVVMADAL
ncbi:hypothetical protein EJ05DRAFT_155185 [Pseudovirgaria hyperparasitica]|uniref:Histone deacetylase interacting domain-containing protein n=1 Tax=Pseudovirgaria hyperparasitica TaxID=470096 RepID=A0A6A6VYB9_9PEZI|nr:uncharacterized protein EJ05DRAFT_155185 [Pseudovirgaria hyperparasitica]KAF2754287.1 hypothetical protein EJ05DRAFT_155185 [Pseudovirgaria hyperparasitica]